MAHSELEKEVNSLVLETSGCGFYITTNGLEFTINITKTGLLFKGDLIEVFSQYIKEVKENRINSKKSKKPYKYE